ncbi:MAG: hypothetical protein EBE86_024375 [Hormoscilla sp. GUM202]|nr:hypothetical protein [Hormoscilla sp. GUM202]
MRVYLYILSGIASASIGWSAGQFIISDLKWLERWPEMALFPCVAISLAIGMVATDIFLNNPTRPKRNLRSGWFPLTIAGGLGLLIGLGTGGITQVLLLPDVRDVIPIQDRFVRIIGWVLIGGAVGIAEGLTWRWRTVEAGDPKRFRERLQTSAIASSLIALVAALAFELLRQQLDGELPEAFREWEDPVGFSFLGALLGFALSIATSPSYMAALRAGAGFEYTDMGSDGNSQQNQSNDRSNDYPRIEKNLKPRLKFVNDDYTDIIEEGRSIQLPGNGKIKIGSVSGNQPNGFGSNICIPGLPPHVADIELYPGKTLLFPNPKAYGIIELKGDRLTSARKIELKHNDMIAFHVDQGGYNGKKLFRFVYYNRFLDPQA